MGSAKARALLDALQANVWRSLGQTPRQPTPEDRAIRDNLVEAIMRGRATLISPDEAERLRTNLLANLDRQENRPVGDYENAGTLSILEELADRLEQSAQRLGYQLPERPELGTLPLSGANAKIFFASDVDHVLVFENGLIMFSYLSAQAIADVLPFRRTPDGGAAFTPDQNEIAGRLDRQPDIARRFGEMIRAYLETGNPALAPYSLQDPTRLVYAGILNDSIELFAMGHEYGHLIRGHSRETRFSVQQEIEADATGVSLSINAMQVRGYDLPLGYLGADFYFTMRHVFNRAKHMLRHGNEVELTVDSAHLAPQARQYFLRQLMRRNNSEQVTTALSIAETVQVITELLWQGLKPRLLAAHQAGIRPLQRWQDD